MTWHKLDNLLPLCTHTTTIRMRVHREVKEKKEIIQANYQCILIIEMAEHRNQIMKKAVQGINNNR